MSSYLGRSSSGEFQEPNDTILLAGFGKAITSLSHGGSVSFDVKVGHVAESWVIQKQNPNTGSISHYQVAVILDAANGDRIVIHMTEDFALRLCGAILGERNHAP